MSKNSISGNKDDRRNYSYSLIWPQRGLQRDVVHLSRPIAPSLYEPKCGGGESCGLRGLSQWVQLWTWSPNKLWRSNSIFNLLLQGYLEDNALGRPYKRGQNLPRPNSLYLHNYLSLRTVRICEAEITAWLFPENKNQIHKFKKYLLITARNCAKRIRYR